MKRSSILRVVDLGEVSYEKTQSAYHAVAACMNEDTPDTLILCRPDSPYLCIGHHQSSLQVLNADVVENSAYPVMRRRLGGGLTYLDNQQQFYQCIFHQSRTPAIPAKMYEMCLYPPINALREVGLRAELRYMNEIEISRRRIAGIGGGRISEASVVVGNVLNDFSYEAMAGILKSPCVEFRELALWAMHNRITTLQSERRSHFWSELPELLTDSYRRFLEIDVIRGELTDKEWQKADELVDVMTATDYLTHEEDFGAEVALPLTRLKISGSTSIRLIEVHVRGERKYAAVVLRDGVVEKWIFIESRPVNDFQQLDILKTNSDELEIGRLIGQ